MHFNMLGKYQAQNNWKFVLEEASR